MNAFLGKYNLSVENETGSSSHSVSEIIIHPEWNHDQDKYDADIAVLQLEEATTFNLFVRSVCLPEHTNDDVTGIGTSVGWGVTENSIDRYEQTPSELKVPAIDPSTCYTTFPRLARYSSTRMFCGGYANQGKAVCTGDAGGGFFTVDANSTWTIRGIVSGALRSATGECDVNAYTLYTNVAKFRNWIAEVIKPKASSSLK